MMKHSVLPLFLTGGILLLILAAPVLAESSAITGISPAVGYTGSTTSVTITGSNFNESSVKVRLMMEDESNITASVTYHTSSEIECKFTISSSRTTGDWDLVVINEDGSEVVESEGFGIRDSMALTSISPTSAQANNDSVDFTLEGSGLSDVSDVYLYNEDDDNITATLDEVNADEITGTFDLTDAAEDTYDVCVVDSSGTEECDLSFYVTTDAVGSIDVSSSPSGASIYVDSSYKGTTPDTVDDLIEGSHKVVLKMTGYNDWGKIVTVTEGDTSTVDADLVVITTVPTTVPTPPPTTPPTTVPTTVKTTRASTTAVLTTWPEETPTEESPVDPALVIGAVGIGLGLVVFRRP
jgi:hypothetical protein